jgi:hypothetical protein
MDQVIAFAGKALEVFNKGTKLALPNGRVAIETNGPIPKKGGGEWPAGLLSVQPDGEFQTRPKPDNLADVGSFESGRAAGLFVVFDEYEGFGHPNTAWVVPVL